MPTTRRFGIRRDTLGLHRVLAPAGLVLILAVAGRAAVVIDSAGFESPTFHTGNLSGQNSWVKLSSGSGSATVENTIANSGSQAVAVDRAAGSDDFWGRHVTAVTPLRYLSIDWDMQVAPSGGDPNTQVGPFIGVLSYDDHANPQIPLSLSGLGIEATFGKVYYELPAGLAATGAVATFNAWHHFRMLLDYSAKTYKVFFDNSLLISTPFVDNTATAFTDADIAAFSVGTDTLAGTGFIDNYVVRSDTLLAGDYDQNGIVNSADYTIWKQNFGASVTAGSGADGNGDGKIDAADYTVWRDHLGQSLVGGAGSGSLSTSAVPEPTSLVESACGLSTIAGWFLCRRRRGFYPDKRPIAFT
jgi:hypothetical protein